MNFDYFESLKRTHPSWRLLNADTAPFVISFLARAFIDTRARGIKESVLEEKMHDHILYLNSIYGNDAYPRRASEYLDDWSDESRGWLRKYYPRLGDEAEYDISPAAEKVIEWLRSFEKREFVGTESRLLLIFQMLRDLMSAAETNPEKRIDELEKRKKEIEDEIQRVRDGSANPFDVRQIKENFWRIDEEIRRLMLDFREVEENFRSLDRQAREKIAKGAGIKGDILDDIFTSHDAIEQSEQGRSFSAFWYFLMSRAKQEELDVSVEKVLRIEGIDQGAEAALLSSMKFNLLDAGDRVKKTLANLNEQLRIFLDEKKWFDNRRIMDLIRSVEEKALELHTEQPGGSDFFYLDSLSPDIDLYMERRLFSPPMKPPVMGSFLSPGIAGDAPEALFSQHYVDEYQLKEHIRQALADKPQVSLGDICAAHPVEKGLSEIVAYIVIASKSGDTIIDASREEVIEYTDRDTIRKVTLPVVLFSR